MKKTKRKKQIISICCAIALTIASTPVGELYAPLNSVYHSLRAAAFSEGRSYPIDSKAALAEYAANYDETHVNDTIIITFGNDTTVGVVSGFVTMATSEETAFNGRIEMGEGIQLDLPTTMFGWVTDDVEIVKANDVTDTSVLAFTRASETIDKPLFAQNVKHKRTSGSANWSFQYDEFRANDTTSNRDVYDFAGYIGTLGENANVKINKIVHKNQGELNHNPTYANISSTGDAGLVCCTMEAGSTLEIDSITCESGDYTVTGATAGGLVGSMAEGSELILGYTTEEVDDETIKIGLSSVQGDEKTITATDGYAGGIVGSCKGVITFNHDEDCGNYSVNQIITGSEGSGGVAGYYETSSTGTASGKTNYAVNYEKLNLSSTCQVNGEGNCGGLFGEVLNDGSMTINDAVGLAAKHGVDTASTFGGLIGSYTADTLSNSLTVTSTQVISPDKVGGDAAYYGGVIGEVSGASYVNFGGVKVNSSLANAGDYFGGLVGAAKSGFVELSNENEISYSGADVKKNYGGVVGDLDKGVLILSGTTDLTDAQNVTSGTTGTGQIVGNRDYGFVWAENQWKLKRQKTGQKLDDIGSWGEVLNYGGGLSSIKGDLFTVTDHSVTLKPASTTITGTASFALAALNAQHNDGAGNAVIQVTDTSSSSTLLASDFDISGATDLRNTGITGLTRDDGTDTWLTYSGTITGTNASITLSTGVNWGDTLSSSYGNGTIYRHSYNGLIAKADGATISGVTITSESQINVNAAKNNMYIGSIAAYSLGTLTIDDVTINGTIQHAGGTSNVRIGGLVGVVSGNVIIGAEDECEFDGTITGASTASTIGGLIGTISNGGAFDSSIKDTTVSGTITSAVSATGGLIGTIADSTTASSSRKLALNNTDISGLSITNTNAGAVGGFLGYQWLKTDVTFDGVDVSGSSSLTANSATDASGLIYRGTGYYAVNAGGIKLDIMSVSATAATSFGLIVNKGYHADKPSAIYLELGEHNGTNQAFTATSNVSLTLGSCSVFDELVAYTGSSSDIMENGHGIVSINTFDGTTESSRLLKMGSSDETNTGLTYDNQTTYGNSHTLNPNARYYYNLDKYRESPTEDAEKLLVWSVRQYAHTALSEYFPGGNVSSLTGTFEMKGYSYYPVNLTGTLTISGTLKLWNPQFDETVIEDRVSTAEAQHKLIHNALLHNLSGTLNANNLTIDGEVSKIGDFCGVLVEGTVGSNDSGKSASVNIDGLTLAGIKIGNENTNKDYAPLLINAASSNSDFQIEDVANAASYVDGAIIATSLLGNIGSSSATNIKLNFAEIKLDGRKQDFANNSAGLDGLDTVYGTKRSLFEKATLIDTFAYQNNSGSYGVYNYEASLDWGTNGSHLGQVTYGAEIDNTVENKDDNEVSKQLKYNGSGVFTHPTTPNAAAKYGAFATNFQRYVNTPYTDGGTNHELRVNISTTSFDGCGTYNDPYQITSGTDLKLIANLINGSHTDTITNGIKVPNTVAGVTANPNSSDTWCHGKTDHTAFTTFNGTARTWSATGGTTITYDKLSEYLAGAYYVIPESVTDKIILASDFPGLSDTSIKSGDEQNVFRGVIIGNGRTIVNNSNKPLIVSSNGSVIKNLKIEVQPSEPMYLKMDSSKEFSYTGTEGTARCQTYGAVIGQIFGGDNIIDNVSVSFSGTVVDAKNAANGSVKSYAQSVPIGGYVGVVVNGGLIFRSMNGTVNNNQAGITRDNLADFACPNTSVADNPETAEDETDPGDPTSENEKMWLYVNPIIGRVINGYAVTEASAYAPYEHGYRTFGDGTSLTGNEVTMHNGTKNYSIANVTKDAAVGKLTLTDESTITVPNGQSFFLMSVMVNSGMAKMSLGYNQAYQVSRYASYTNVGDAADSNDYQIAKGDVLETTGTKTVNNATVTYNKTAHPGYLAHAYTNNETYAADMANQSTKITLANTTYVLPDGYKGIGNMFIDSDDYRLKVTNFTGNGATISQNSSYYYFAKIKDASAHTNETFDTVYTHAPANVKVNNKDVNNNNNIGFGLFNNQTGSTTNISSSRYFNFTLTGNIDVDCIDVANGEHIFYLGANKNSGNPGHTDKNDNFGIDQAYMVNAGMLMGVSNAQQTIDSVALVNVKIHGVKNTGGMIGCVPYAKTTITNEQGTSSERIIVHGAGSAGGVLGKNQQGEITINNGGASYSITEIISECEFVDPSGDFNYGVGAFVGACRTADNPINIRNIVVGASDQAVPTVVKCDGADVFAGGMIGVLNKGTLTVEDCEIYNQSVTSPYVAGGLFGYYASAGGPANIDHVTVYAKDYKSDTISNPRITSNNKAVGGFFGAIKDEFKSGKIVISNSSITGYNITSTQSGGYAGGAIGLFGHKAANTASSNNIDLSLNNVTILKCEINANSENGYAGGLVGGMAERADTYKHLNGYNILTKNLSISGKYPGAICGKTLDKDYCVIKLAGFSRQADDVSTMKKALVAAPASSQTPFGEGGYVVFADYDDKASGAETQNAAFANFSTIPTGQSNVTNWQAVGSREVEVEYKVKAKNTNGTLSNIEQVDSEIKSVTKSDTILTTGSGNNVTPLADGVKQEVSCSGSKMGLVSETVRVSDLSELTALNDEGTTNGFKMVIDWYVAKNASTQTAGPHYFTSTIIDTNGNVSNNGVGSLKLSTVRSEGAVWFFEKEGNYYKLYTYVDNTKKYLKMNSDKTNIELSDEFDLFDLETDSTSFADSWHFKRKNTQLPQYYLQYSQGGKGIRYYKDPPNATTQAAHYNFRMEYLDESVTLKSWTYADAALTEQTPTITSYYNPTTNSLSLPNTTASGPSDPTTAQTSEFETYCGTEDKTLELYTITRTYKENIYAYADNVDPLVTTSPKYDIVKDGDDSVQWLTSDGVTKVGYLNSTSYNILHDIALDTNKSYQNTGMPVLDTKDDKGNYITMGRQTLVSILTDKMSGFTAAHKCDMSEYHGEEFPVLVIDDIGAANHIVNNYLKVLTNTDFNFYQTSLNSDVFNVVISKMQYDTGLNEFVKVDGTAALRLDPNRYFEITPTDFDNDSLQFSLLEVQFKDPGDSTKIVYHLYVPVVVTKMLHYDFTARFSSGTTYDLSEYPNSVRNLIENLGNPVTLKCTYTYKQNATDWAAAINAGENVQRNYAKELMLKDTGDRFPENSTLILVDPNANEDRYYSTPFAADSPVLTVDNIVIIDGVTTVEYKLKLADFPNFNPVKLNDLMIVSLDSSDTTEKTLVEDNSNYTVIINDGNTNNGLKLRLATDDELTNASITKYAVSVSLPEGQTYPQENYYLSFFTKAKPSDTAIYHYEISSTGKFPETDYPSARTSNESPHLFLGNLYTNQVTLIDGNPLREMSRSNNYLEAQLSASVGFTPHAISGSITSYIQNDNVKVYQTFLTSLNMMKSDSSQSRGLLVKPTATVTSYTVEGVDRKANLEPIQYSNSYVEIPNSYSIKEELREAALSNPSNPLITIAATVRMTYDPDSLSFQFPNSDESATDVGTYVIGYSNISSSSGRGAASRESKNTDVTPLPAERKLYYMRNISPVIFHYNAVANNTVDSRGNGNYGQLGINANEETSNYVQINTAGIYDISGYGLKKDAHYIKIIIKLSKKSDYATALDIPTYLTGYELLDKNNTNVHNTSCLISTVGNEYTYVIPLEDLQTVSTDVYKIPVNFKAYTGYNTDFERKNDEANNVDMEYSNYRITMTVGLMKNENDTSVLLLSDKPDYVIYTNARLLSDIVTPKSQSGATPDPDPGENPGDEPDDNPGNDPEMP